MPQPKPHVEMYTDGACSGNPGPGGWAYILKHEVPYNPLHDNNYPSLGCTYCTKAVQPGDDPRSGRWQGIDKIECGIHTPGEPIPLARGEEITG